MKINLKTKPPIEYGEVVTPELTFSVYQGGYYIISNPNKNEKFEDICFKILKKNIEIGMQIMYPDQVSGVIVDSVGELYWKRLRPCTIEEVEEYKRIEDAYKIEN